MRAFVYAGVRSPLLKILIVSLNGAALVLATVVGDEAPPVL